MPPRRLVIEPIDPVMIEIYRSKTPAEKLAIANGLWKTARAMVTAGIRAQHPDWCEADVARETARRMSHGAV